MSPTIRLKHKFYTYIEVYYTWFFDQVWDEDDCMDDPDRTSFVNNGFIAWKKNYFVSGHSQ